MNNNEATVESMNEVIALFMGGSSIKEHGGKRYVYYPNSCAKAISDLKYHISWDSLIPVVKKIKGMHFDILQRTLIMDYMQAAGPMNSGLISLDIDKVHAGVYQFLTWYNQQTKPEHCKQSKSLK